MMSALLAAAWHVAMLVIGGATFPGYDHVGQFISELGATGAPRGFEMSWYGFLPIGVFMIAFAVFTWLAAPRSVLLALGLIGIFLYAVGYLGTAVFPCDYGCRPEQPSFAHQMHLLFGLGSYLFAPLMLALLALAVRKWPNAGWLFVIGIVTAVGALGGLMTFDESSPYVGLSQRVIEVSVIGWVLACGLYLGLQPRTSGL
jgi:hypothetical protein